MNDNNERITEFTRLRRTDYRATASTFSHDVANLSRPQPGIAKRESEEQRARDYSVACHLPLEETHGERERERAGKEKRTTEDSAAADMTSMCERDWDRGYSTRDASRVAESEERRVRVVSCRELEALVVRRRGCGNHTEG